MTRRPNPHAGGRYLLRFWAVDYMAEVWLNGLRVGEHEGGETPFVLDVTDTIRSGAKNLLAVRVLNPTHERIDGIVLSETPKQARVMPYFAGAAYNHGGITGSVELLAVPSRAGRGSVRSRRCRRRASSRSRRTCATPANSRQAGGWSWLSPPPPPAKRCTTAAVDSRVSAGRHDGHDTAEDRPAAALGIERPVSVSSYGARDGAAAGSTDERSVRCGFREFRFEKGYFRLNGRRLFLRSTHTCNHFPVGLKLPPDPDMARRDLLDVKAMGFNMIRFIWGGAERYQLDLCDEIGLMVYEESFASWPMQDSPQLAALGTDP